MFRAWLATLIGSANLSLLSSLTGIGFGSPLNNMWLSLSMTDTLPVTSMTGGVTGCEDATPTFVDNATMMVRMKEMDDLISLYTRLDQR